MNSHEIERIAAAMNQARPDWPTKQLTTLLTDERMVNRPRRDVFVALAWIACESGTATPYRVLEAGPWWRAAGVEGIAIQLNVWDPAAVCTTCSRQEAQCRSVRHADDTHPFVSRATNAQQTERPADAVALIVAELKGRVATAEPSPEPERADVTPNPHAQAARAALAVQTTAPEGAS
jgi:hypothetical protein